MNLLPLPQKIEQLEGVHALNHAPILLVGERTGALWFAATRLKAALLGMGVPCEISANRAALRGHIVLAVDAAVVRHEQGYTLTITRDEVSVVGGSAQGVFYGVCTLLQLLRLAGFGERTQKSLPCVRIEDRPDFERRGVMLDVSRDKVPTMDTLLELVDRLAGLKLNELQLYTEHTFAYRDHKTVWQNASPFTPEEMQQLDVFCRARFIDLVPNQNSFGHMHRWLKHAPYRALAETHDDFLAWGAPRKGPFGLNPLHPGSLTLLQNLYDDLLPNFGSRQFNVGLDETIDLGQGASKAACEKLGKGRVYVDFLKKIHAEVGKRGRVMQFWGDIIIHHPELIPELPEDAVAMEWGYERDHPFDANSAKFAAAGLPFYVCPGTSSWVSLVGRTTNAIGNLRNAAENGLKHGAIGYLNTDWGDYGHWQTLPVSFLGFGYGAALSWAHAANRDMDLPAALSAHIFEDPSGVMGKLVHALGQNPDPMPRQHNSNPIVRVMIANSSTRVTPRDTLLQMKITPVMLQQAKQHITASLKPIHKHAMRRADAALIVRELELGGAMLQFGADYALALLGRGPDAKTLDAARKAIVTEHKKVWLKRNRPGGLAESVARLNTIR